MSHYQEHIGKVVGKDGKTYVPEVELIQNSNQIKFTFTPIDENDEEQTVEYIKSLPMIKPVHTQDNHLIFQYTYDENILLPDINLNDLRGPAGSLTVENINVDDIVSANTNIQSNGNFTTIGQASKNNEPLKDSVLYVLNSNNKPQLSGDTYIVNYNQDNDRTEWTRITDFMNADAYALKSEFEDFKAAVNQNMNCIALQQRTIQDILRNGES